MQLSPKLVTAAEARIWTTFKSVMRTYCGLLSTVSLAYMGVLVVAAVVSESHLAILRDLDYGVAAMLLGSALVTAVASPFGSAIVALRGENWLLFGPAASLALQLAVSFTLFKWLGPMAIAIGIAAQNAVSSAVVIVGTAVIFRRKAASP